MELCIITIPKSNKEKKTPANPRKGVGYLKNLSFSINYEKSNNSMALVKKIALIKPLISWSIQTL